ncbi:Protein of unknown function [Lactobacillus pasteurii DSM 23907 = CRBIP 24.76]|uniref:Uncharacterized protein n=1 Tax=Lactobacillus pasteurii DSM 23907 = CRBIP 24.76 TaxID=1423790 RepID=I7LD47_9LACO|nr:Protein of unknown function [Lactobacillus pasteurii DSM 23907 = CRBIP 24.76]
MLEGVFWLGGRMLMRPLQKLITLKWVDSKYPLTASRIDKNRKNRKDK